MKKMTLVVLAIVILSCFGCGASLAEKQSVYWRNMYSTSDKAKDDPVQFEKDFNECKTYSIHKINIPFMHYAHTATGWYDRCMKIKGYK